MGDVNAGGGAAEDEFIGAVSTACGDEVEAEVDDEVEAGAGKDGAAGDGAAEDEPDDGVGGRSIASGAVLVLFIAASGDAAGAVEVALVSVGAAESSGAVGAGWAGWLALELARFGDDAASNASNG